MQKKVLTEQALYYGDVVIPKDWDIDREKLSKDILESNIKNSKISFSKNLDMLDTYIKEHTFLEYNINLVEKNKWGNIYKPNQTSKPLLDVNPVDLKNSPDFTLLYGVKVNKCWVRIYYEDNKRKGKFSDIELIDNKFIMFPSNNMYCITNDQKDSLNFIQTITYEYI
tara:strand:- start:263 stop:766 length:504 start_codon:yes stop_codon:yes gene_type:complete